MKIPKKVIDALKEDIDRGRNPTICYYDRQYWALYTDGTFTDEINRDSRWIYCSHADISSDYIPAIARFLIECTKQGIDITKIKLESA